MNTLGDRLAEIRQRIATAAHKSGRTADDVRLIAVSKTKPVEIIQSLLDLGQKDFGENQIQEGLKKVACLEGRDLNWHFIGHLQSNKSKFIPGNFSWVHSVDNEKLAWRLARAGQESGHSVNLLLQVNVSNDPAKYGVRSCDVFPLVEGILERKSEFIRLRGLMTLGYRGAGDEEIRRTFAGLRRLLEQCRERFGESLTELSMGMSGDYELAVEEGATMVRVGTALFGERA